MQGEHIVRSNLKVSIGKKIINSLAAGITIALVIIIVQSVNFGALYGFGSSAVIFASIGSSAFILFVMPKSRAANKTALVISYSFAGIVGYFAYILSVYFGIALAAAIAITAVSSLMVVSKQEHPPAVGLALAFVLYRIDAWGILLVISLGVFIAVISYGLQILIKDTEKEI
jgi:CBS-domain-containing membrane protein